jgi:hypothetical protein
VMTRLRQRWQGLRSTDQTVFVAGVVSVIAAVVHQLMLVRWYIEDAAISFTFARNLAAGHGLVAYPGGERVEGYSNPLWTFLLAIPEVFGISSFTSSKMFAAVLAALTVAVVVDLVRRIRPEGPFAPVLAGVILAANPQFAIWGASGLENALFSALLAVGLWCMVREADGRWPWSALALAGVALTRPEGIAYAAIVGVWTLWLGRRWAAWLVTFWVPFGAHQVWRQWYFAWPFPNTYYAKSGVANTKLLDFDRKSWTYVYSWAMRQWQIGLIPLWWAAVSTLRGNRFLAPLVTAQLLFVLAVVYLVGGTGEEGEHIRMWTSALAAILVGSLVVMPIVGRRGLSHPVSGVCLHLLGFGLFFAMYADGDWMKAWRWMSLISVPIAVLTAVGTVEFGTFLASFFKGWARDALYVATMAAVALVALTSGIRGTYTFAQKPETSPFSIKRRVAYMARVQERLHLDHVVTLDVDMGGIMWWSGHELSDIAGLIDVPMAHNHYEHDFVSEYLFQERRPDFAHVHGGWASKLKIRRHSEWEEHYLELPPYPAGGTSSHPGNHVAKRHLVTDTWERGRGATFAWPVNPEEQVDVDAIRAPSEVRIVGWRAPVETGEIGGSLFLEVAMSATGIETATDHFRVTGFLAWPDGARVFFDVAPGYDWYEPSQWLPDDIVVSRIAVPIPDNVETGHPDLGFFVTDRDGVMPVETWSSGALSDFPQASSGEIRWPEAIWIRPSEDILTLALDHMSLLSDTAYMGDCSIAEDLWYAARAYRAHDLRWVTANRQVAARSLAECWLENAKRQLPNASAWPLLEKARWWDLGVPGLDEVSASVARQLEQNGYASMSLGDYELAYAQLSQALRIDPTLSHARRAAEEARRERLHLDDDPLDPLQRRLRAPRTDGETR